MRRLLVFFILFSLLLPSGSAVLAETSNGDQTETEAPTHKIVPGFDLSIEDLDPLLIELVEKQKEWDASTIPQTLDEIPIKPDGLIRFGDELNNIKAKITKKGDQYTIITNIAELPALAEMALSEPDAVDYPDSPEGDPHVAIGGRAKKGGNYDWYADRQENDTYIAIISKENNSMNVKYGEWVGFTNCWQEGPWFWMISATKYLANIKNDWADTVFIEIRKSFVRGEHKADYIIKWGYDPKQKIFLFNVKDYPEGTTGFVAQYSTKTGKLIHFNRPGNYLLTGK